MAAKRSRTRRANTSRPDDPATAYALAVAAGTEPAGPHVRDACARHLRDLEDGAKRGLTWDVAAVDRVIGFFRDVLRVDKTAADTVSGDEATKPFDPLGWQCFVLGSLFGWRGADGYRRFRVAFIEAPKGCGKSPLAAGVGLYMLTADGEPRAEVYAAAVKKDQAKVLFRDAVAMVDNSPDLAERLVMSGGNEKHNIAYLATGSFFRPISSEERGRGQSGPRPHCSLLDEVHEHPTNAMVEFLRAGTKGRRQALNVMITNSGSDRESVCFHHHTYGAKVASGLLEDDSYFAYICGLDDGDDPLHDPSVWAKANPSLNRVVTEKYLAEQVREALGMPSKQNLVLRLNFCRWTDSENAWIGRDAWMACEDEINDEPGSKCFAAIDLSAKRDLTALALVFPNDDGTLDARLEFWSPGDTLRAREDTDNVPYTQWRDEGHLSAPDGKTIDYAYVAKRIAELAGRYEIAALAFDRWRIDDLVRELDDLGVECWIAEGEKAGSGLKLVPFGQGFKDMSPAVEDMERAILDGKLFVQPNPVLRWNVASAVTEEDPAGNRKFTKRKATGRIDGLIALTMAVRMAMTNIDEPVAMPQLAWL